MAVLAPTRPRGGMQVLLHRPLFDTVVVRGEAPPQADVVPALMWGYRQAARLRTWTVRKARDPRSAQLRWTLTATIDRVDDFSIRQRPLFFAAPRPQNGFWMWPVLAGTTDNGVVVKGNTLTANLGQPEF